MSGFLAGKVWHSALDGNLKPLAACLAECGNDDGSGVFPSVGFLQWMLGWSESSVRRGMKALRDLRVLVAEANLAGGRGLVPVYHLDIEALPQRASWREFRKGVQIATLSKRVSPVTEKGVTGDGKGCHIQQCNKEDPPETRQRPARAFPPSREDVRAYCKQRDNSVDPELWFDHYQSNGWKVGKTSMKDWQAAVRTWERTGFNNGNGSGKAVLAGETLGEKVRRQEVESNERAQRARAARQVACQ